MCGYIYIYIFTATMDCISCSRNANKHKLYTQSSIQSIRNEFELCSLSLLRCSPRPPVAWIYSFCIDGGNKSCSPFRVTDNNLFLPNRFSFTHFNQRNWKEFKDESARQLKCSKAQGDNNNMLYPNRKLFNPNWHCLELLLFGEFICWTFVYETDICFLALRCIQNWNRQKEEGREKKRSQAQWMHKWIHSFRIYLFISQFTHYHA